MPPPGVVINYKPSKTSYLNCVESSLKLIVVLSPEVDTSMFCPVKVKGFVFKVCVLLEVLISNVLVSTPSSMVCPFTFKEEEVKGFTFKTSSYAPVHSNVFSLIIRLMAPPLMSR